MGSCSSRSLGIWGLPTPSILLLCKVHDQDPGVRELISAPDAQPSPVSAHPNPTATQRSHPALALEISSSWLARWALQWTQLYVRWQFGRYAWKVLDLVNFTISAGPSTLSPQPALGASRLCEALGQSSTGCTREALLPEGVLWPVHKVGVNEGVLHTAGQEQAVSLHTAVLRQRRYNLLK